jgi:hypothetical protein
MSEHPLHPGSKVALLPGCEEVYKKASPGAQATITDTRIDEDGFNMVFVEWDKTHWRYSGQDDQWTYAEHFTAIDEHGIFAALEDPEAFANQIMERAKERGKDDEMIEEFIDRLDEVVNVLSESEGFIVITARREPHPLKPDKSFVAPYIFGAFMNEGILALLESQIAQLSAASNQEMAIKLLKQYQESEDDEGDDSQTV